MILKNSTLLFKREFQFLLLFLIYAVVVSLFLTGTIEDYHIYSFVLLIPVFIVSYIFYLSNYKSPNFLRNLLIITTVLKICFVFIIAQYLELINGIPFLSYKDDFVYNSSAIDIVNRWNLKGIAIYDDIRFASGFYSGYPNLSALAMWIFGKSIYVPRILNVLFSSATVYYFYKTLKLENAIIPARQVTTIFAFSLTFVFFAAFQLKDTVLLYIISVMIYFLSVYLKNGGSIKSILILITAGGSMLFFRAAAILPIMFALVFTLLLLRSIKFFSIRNILTLSLFTIGFIFLWNYLNSIELLNHEATGYIESRAEHMGTSKSRSGSNSLSNLGFLKYILGPIYLIFSLFLPTATVVDLNPNLTSLNYHYIPVIQYYAILPISIVGILAIIRKRTINKAGIFILFFILIYKLGQTGTKSIFDSRQSLPAIYGLYLILAYSINNTQIDFSQNKKAKKIIAISVLLMLVVLFAFSFFRLTIRGEL